MSDRTVKVTLIAQATGYVQGFDQATRKTRELGSEAEKLAQKRQSFEILGRSMLAVGIAAAVGVGMAVAKYAEFDQAMSQVNAVTQESVANQNLLRDAALEAGGATVYTAKEAANAQEELAKAGLSTSYILGGALTGSLNLAAAGQLEVARSAEITGVTLKQFGLDGSQAARVADVLAAGANKAVGGVEELAQGLKFVGPVADSMNVSLEDTVATLTLFADRGILGEQAGTSLRGVLSSLTSPSKAAREELDRLNVTLYDAETKRFLGLENATGELNRALGDVTDAERDMSLGLIFGNQQVTAARVLVGAGAETWREYRSAVDESGIAARIAAERMDNLSGDVEKLGGAFDTALIQSGSGANDVLRNIVQAATFLLDTIGGLPAPVLSAGLAVGVLIAAVGIAGGAALIAVPKFAALKVTLSDMNISGGRAAASIGLIGGALALATFVIGAFVAANAAAASRTDSFRESLDQTTGALTENTRALVVKELREQKAFESAAKAGISQRELTDAVMAGGDALARIKDRLAEATSGGEGFKNLWDGASFAIVQTQGDLDRISSSLVQSKKDFENATAATGENTSSTLSAADAYKAASDEVSSLQSDLSSLIDTLNRANGLNQDAITANASYQSALQDARNAVAELAAANGVSTENINQSTAAGSSNVSMLAELASKSQDAAQAALEAGGSQDSYVESLQAGRQAVYDMALGLTGNAEAALALTDIVYAMPTQHEIDFIADTAEATRQIQTFIDGFSGRTIWLNVATRYAYESGSVGGIPGGYAYGGYTGPGAKHEVAGIVHADEFVSTKETLAKPSNRAALEYMHAGGDISQWGAAPRQERWQSAPPTFATAGSAVSSVPQFNVIVESKGGVDLLQYVDVRIEQKDRSDHQATIGRYFR